MNKYYAVLGLPTTASKDEIRKKYRKLVLIWHPDRNSSPEAQGKFIAITEAYDILMGERTVPRSKTSNNWPKQPGQRPSAGRAQQQAQRHTSKAQLMRSKFEKIRNDHRNSSNALARKKEMETKAQTYFILTGAVGLAAIVLPFLLGFWNLIWIIPTAFGFGAQLLWKGGRFKIRSEMIFGSRTHYSDEEIAEFFVERPGFGRTTEGENNYR